MQKIGRFKLLSTKIGGGDGVRRNAKMQQKNFGGAYITDIEAGRYNFTIASDERDES